MYLGNYAAGSTVDYSWNTTAVGVGSITRATNGTVRIYKNNSTTERTSSNGITDTEDFDSATGNHHLTIDLSDDTDAGFYAAGNDYFVKVIGMVVDGETFNVVIAQFSIENRFDEVNVTQIEGADPSDTIRDAVVDDATRIDASALNTASGAIGSDGSGLTEAGGDGDHLTAINLPDQTMNITGNITGNLSGSVGSVTGAINTAAGTITTLDGLDTAQDSQHSTTQSAISGVDGKIDTAQADLDILTGTDGATLATSQPNYAPAVAGDIPTAAENATELLDQAAGVETNRTVRQVLRLMAAALLGKASGLNTTTVVYRDTNDGVDRITATVDQFGNRSSVSLDPS